MSNNSGFTTKLKKTFLLFSFCMGMGGGMLYLSSSIFHVLSLIDAHTEGTARAARSTLQGIKGEILSQVTLLATGETAATLVDAALANKKCGLLESIRQGIGASSAFLVDTTKPSGQVISVNRDTVYSFDEIQSLVALMSPIQKDQGIQYVVDKNQKGHFLFHSIVGQPDPIAFSSDSPYILFVDLDIEDHSSRLYTRIESQVEESILFFDITRYIEAISTLNWWNTFLKVLKGGISIESCTIISGESRIAFCTTITATNEYEYLSEQIFITTIILMLFLLLSLYFSDKLSQALTKPLNQLIAGMRSAENGAYTQVSVDGNGQIGYLAASYNTLISKIKKTTEELRQQIRNHVRVRTLLETVLDTLEEESIIILKNKSVLYISKSTLRIMAIVEEHAVCTVYEDTDQHYLWTSISRIFGDLDKDSIRQVGTYWFDIRLQQLEQLDNISVIIIRDITKLYSEKKTLESYCAALIQSTENVQKSLTLGPCGERGD